MARCGSYSSRSSIVHCAASQIGEALEPLHGLALEIAIGHRVADADHTKAALLAAVATASEQPGIFQRPFAPPRPQ